jgi:hypothetical protein
MAAAAAGDALAWESQWLGASAVTICEAQQRSANALQRFRYRPFRSEEIYQF